MKIFIDLIIDMKRCNQVWGSQRISDELKLMGIRVSKITVLKILRENGFVPPRTRFTPPPWNSVLDSFCRYWSMDFTSVFDSKGAQLFVLAIIEIHSRKLIIINPTENPTKSWLIQQFRNCSILGHEFPRAMVHDRDGIYGNWLPGILKEFDCQSVKILPKSPWLNPFVERFHLSLKTEILNRVRIVDDHHARYLCSSYQEYFNKLRPHQGIEGKVPDRQAVEPKKIVSFEDISIKKTKILDGLATQFRIAA